MEQFGEDGHSFQALKLGVEAAAGPGCDGCACMWKENW